MKNGEFECQCRQHRRGEAETKYSGNGKNGGFLLYCLRYSFSLIDFGIYLVDFLLSIFL